MVKKMERKKETNEKRNPEREKKKRIIWREKRV